MAQQPNAILAISSTDRYITSTSGNVNQPTQNTILAQYFNRPPYSNDFSIEAPGALMNGYIDKIIISQIQVQYNVPTIIPKVNDKFLIAIETGAGTSVYSLLSIRIPYGFYTGEEIAAIIDLKLNEYPPLSGQFSVTYSQLVYSFVCEASNRFFFPSPDYILSETTIYTESDIEGFLKAYRYLGVTLANAIPNTKHISSSSVQFIYSPYIDIYSDALTNYQALKDTNTSTSRRKGLIARMYLSGVGNPQLTSQAQTSAGNLTFSYNGEEGTGTIQTTYANGAAFGTSPFTITLDLNSPKIVNWTPDTAINTLDFQMRDCYGELLFCALPGTTPNQTEVYNTEWQMTLLCVEG